MKKTNMRHTLCAAAALLLTALPACDGIPAGERLIYVEPVPVSRAVLVEDFTGQKCNNCPMATAEIEKLIAQYGDTAIIAVAIHSGPMGQQGVYQEQYEGLMTDLGQTYYEHWGADRQPIGQVDRAGGLLDYALWTGIAGHELKQSPALSVEITAAELDTTDRSLHIATRIIAIEGTTNGHLQLWIVEDGVVSFQVMPDGTTDYAYVHNHVLRDAVNGTWGEEVSVSEGGEVVTREHSYTLPPVWDEEQVSVVAFVYDDSGVKQVTKSGLSLKGKQNN